MTDIDTDYKSLKQGVPRVRPRPEVVTITKEQERAWEETRTLMLMTCPAFSHILYTMMNPSKKADVAYWTEEVPIAATDGVALLLNPKKFFGYDLNERVFIVSHEIMHCIFNHCGMMQVWNTTGTVGYVDGTFLKYDSKIMNKAADYVINAQLIKAKVGKYSTNWLYDPQLSVSGEESVIDVYRKIYKDNPGGGGKGGQESFDEHLPPGTTESKDPTEAQQERSDVEWRTAVAAAVASSKAQGKLPASLERLFSDVLDPPISWKEHVQAFFARKVGTGGYDWRRPDEHLIVRGLTSVLPGRAVFAPGRSGFGSGTIIMAGDTSGSIDFRPGRVGDKFLNEMAGLLDELKPKRLVLMWCDAEVHQVDEVEDASDIENIRSKKIGGGGGTSFVPVFEEVKKMGLEPDALIYLTDGYGSFPEHAPSYPVLWGSISSATYPFGDVVDLTALNQ